MVKVITYIDGFNLYHGLRDKYGRKYIWLNLEKLSRSLLKSGQQLSLVKYFTSRIGGKQAKVHRQAIYLDALTILPLVKIYFGHYLTNDHTCPACGNIEHIPTEKMTDVNIATQMLVDAYEDAYDVAILISGDSDLSGTISELKRLFPKKMMIVAFPPKRASFVLKQICHGYIIIGESKFAHSQFPNIVVKPDGYQLQRPATWT